MQSCSIDIAFYGTLQHLSYLQRQMNKEFIDSHYSIDAAGTLVLQMDQEKYKNSAYAKANTININNN